MLVAIASRSFARRPKSCECLSSETKINAISADSYKTNALSNTSLSTTLPGADDLPRSDYTVGFLFSCLPANNIRAAFVKGVTVSSSARMELLLSSIGMRSTCDTEQVLLSSRKRYARSNKKLFWRFVECKQLTVRKLKHSGGLS